MVRVVSSVDDIMLTRPWQISSWRELVKPMVSASYIADAQSADPHQLADDCFIVPAPAERYSVYEDSDREAERYKWIESEKVGYDLGESALKMWVRQHWHGFVRSKWIEHLEGKCFWSELDKGDFALLKRAFHDQPVLLDRILDRLKIGQENLHIFLWAEEWNIPSDLVRQILEALDINSHRLEHRFDPICC